MKKNRKGFTLIEIIVVIVILAVLMAVAVPSVLKYINEADNAKYLTVSRAINEEVNIYIAKQMIEKSDQDFGKTVQQLKADLSYNYEGVPNKIKSIISTKALDGEMIYSIDCEFDGLISKEGKGWAYNEAAKTHNVTKISIWFRKTGETGAGLTENSKFVVTLLNEKMYPYMKPADAYAAHGKKEGPIIGL